MTNLILTILICCVCEPVHVPAHVRLSQPKTQPVCQTGYVPAHIRLSQPRNGPVGYTGYVPAHVRLSQPTRTPGLSQDKRKYNRERSVCIHLQKKN